MKEKQKERIAAFFLAAIITTVVIGSMIIYHEESSAFKEFLNNLTGHHWVSKSIIAIVLFPILSIVFYLIFSSEKLRRILKTNDVLLWSKYTIVVTVLFVLGSFLVFVMHFIAS